MKSKRSIKWNYRSLAPLFTTCLCLAKPLGAYAIAGLEGTFEFGLDAPWRIEPSKTLSGAKEYGAIPIQITIHDARNAKLDDIIYTTDTFPVLPNFNVTVPISLELPPEYTSLGKIHSIRITEMGPAPRNTIEFPLSSLHEIEETVGSWPWPMNPAHPPIHKLCRLWKGENPEPFRDISQTSEWHATMWYVPFTKTPGSSVSLKIEVILDRPPLPQVKTPHNKVVPIDVASQQITLRNYVRVFLAPDALPRFDNRWLYGDFHYHSQGTDNEGEVGYNYRGVIRAMGSMGLDFLFAVDHASSSAQIEDADLPPIDKITEIAHAEGDKLREKDAKAIMNVARDMNVDRFAFSHDLIYATNGANREASVRAYNSRFPQNYLTHKTMPQIFLGGEIDAIPELKASTIDALNPLSSKHLSFPYGNGLSFDMSQLCAPFGCDSPRDSLLQRVGDSYLVHDFQSLESFQFFGREHLLYFPNSSSLFVGNESAFIPSLTSRFGGATRRLEGDLLPEIERKGVTFIAHHLNGSGSRGPDGIPWTTDHMLLKAFRSPAVLGMEFWNEDIHYHSRVCSHDFCRPDQNNGIFLGEEYGYERHEKLEARTGNPFIDAILAVLSLPGINYDALPKEFHQIALPLEEVRRGFISGGTRGGLFELNPFDVVHGLWQDRDDEVEHEVTHGSYDWDLMNLRGLDFEHNTDLKWLKPGEPRRMFMAGGSDAHGDLNYRRAGYFLGTDDANDAAIGKPRNLVFAGNPQGPVIAKELPVATDVSVAGTATSAGGTKGNTTGVTPVTGVATMVAGTTKSVSVAPPPASINVGGIGALGTEIRAHTQEQIISALRSGHFAVTDGPAIRTAIDLNGNNVIDDGDIQMGDIYNLEKPVRIGLPNTVGQTVTFITEVVSTQEFGPIMDLDLYIGVHPNPPAPGSKTPVEPRLYSTLSHGPNDGNTDGVHATQVSYQSHGRTYVRLKDNYWNGDFLDKLTWHQIPGDPLKYTLTFVTTLHLDNYEVGQGISADRFFVRAYTRCAGNALQDIPERYAFSNPIWIVRHSLTDVNTTTTGASSAFAPPLNEPTIRAERSADGKIVLNFNGTCQYSPGVGQPFSDLPEATSPYIVPPTQRSGFFRARE